jgi:hypothetical protein
LNAFGTQPQDNSLDRVPNTFHVHSLQKLLGNTPYLQSLANFPGPLSNADKVQKFVADKVNSPSDSNDPESARLLWQLIKILCDHYGNISGVDNPAQKLIKEILTENVQNNTQAPLLLSPRASHEEHASVLELQRLIVAGNVDEVNLPSLACVDCAGVQVCRIESSVGACASAFELYES